MELIDREKVRGWNVKKNVIIKDSCKENNGVISNKYKGDFQNPSNGYLT